MESNSIGKRIRQRRIELGMTQDELGKILGYQNRSSINKIECDERNLTQSKIKAISDALKTTPDFIMGWTDISAVESPEDRFNDALLNRLLAYMKLLNPKGIDELLKRAGELVQLPQYTSKEKER